MYFAVWRQALDCFFSSSVARPKPFHQLALAFLVLASPAASTATQPSVDLSPRPADAAARVKVVVEVAGSLKLGLDRFEADGGQQESKRRKAHREFGENKKNQKDAKKEQVLALSVAAELLFDEKHVSHPAAPSSLRYYQSASADIRIGEEVVKPTLRDQRRLIRLVERDGSMLVYAPEGPLTREELELIDVPGSTIFLDRLLPARPVTLEETWTHTDDVAAALLGLEAVTDGDVASKLVEITKEVAKIDISGRVTGSANGVTARLKVEGHYHCRLSDRQITWLALSIEEARDIGYATPGLDVKARIRVIREPVAAIPSDWGERLVVGDLAERSETAEMLDYTSAENGFRLVHDRRWFVFAERGHSVSLRMVDQGRLIATCTISTLPKLPVGKDVTLEAFQADIQRALAQHIEQLIEASESAKPGDVRVLRVVAAGTAGNVPVRWIYYHVSHPDGRRLSYVFSLSPEDTHRFAAADEQLTESLRFLVAQTPGEIDIH
jgi:hypothetical protein